MNWSPFIHQSGRVLAAVCFGLILLASPVNAEEKSASNKPMPKAEAGSALEEFIEVLEWAAQEPEALQKHIESELEKTQQLQEKKQKEMDALQRKIDFLQRLFPKIQLPSTLSATEPNRVEGELPPGANAPIPPIVSPTYDDTEFPRQLRVPYTGTAPERKRDNTFLTYYQLRRKIKTVFDDDWQRNEHDRFQENIHLFQGADFQLRFNESSTPSASFLTGLDLLGQDVASQAYLSRSGPFVGLNMPMTSLADAKELDVEYSAVITQLYERILYRKPSEAEIQNAYQFMKNISSAFDPNKERGSTLAFELTVMGDADIPTTRSFVIEVQNQNHSLYQQFVDLKRDTEAEEEKEKIGESFILRAGDEGQVFTLSNRDTRGIVAMTGIEVVGPLPERNTVSVPITDAQVKLKGPWHLRDREGKQWIDDGDEQKGDCLASIPLVVPRDGQYEIYMKWPKARKRPYAERVMVEVVSHDQTQLVKVPQPARPPQGEAHFWIDQTVDAVSFWDLKTAFRFGNDQQYVEINNKDTSKRVTADAVKFVPQGDGAALLVDEDRAEGKENWPIYTEYSFRPYNITGANTVNDQNKRKGELAIRYKPATQDRWKKDAFYRVNVGFPGQEDNDTHVPVVVKAAASSPIVYLSYPHHAPVGTEIEVDASASYDIQNSSLTFQWKQIGGPRVELENANGPVVSFVAPKLTTDQAAWEGLVRAMIKHPDFVFTRPPSVDQTQEESMGNELLLVKIAQDLAARPPLAEELDALRNGIGLDEMIERYFQTQEFKDFYFHRIRLFLESQGTVEEDEPARLWCYIALNDRPFKEILTADYTVDTAMKKQGRPAHFGRTGLLTMKGFIKGKPGLPHYNYPAMVAEKFLGYVFEVPPEIVDQRDGVTAASTTDPTSACYSCHKLLTPLAFQRLRWNDDGEYRTHDERGVPLDDSDQKLVATYPYPGNGMEAFSLVAANQERFIRTIIQVHSTFYLGREIRYDQDERELYRQLWEEVNRDGFRIKALIKAIMKSEPYGGVVQEKKVVLGD